jgi:hypothetical protein
MPTLQELGQLVKRKYPGAYDALDDRELARAVQAKYPGSYDDYKDAPTIAEQASAAGGLKVSEPKPFKPEIRPVSYIADKPGQRVAFGAETAGKAIAKMAQPDTPLVEFDKPRRAAPTALSWEKIATGVKRSGLKNIEGLITPKNIGIGAGLAAVNAAGALFPPAAPLAMAANATAGTYFASEMAKALPEQYVQYSEALKRGDTEAAAEALTDIGATGAMATGIGKHTVGSMKPAVQRQMTGQTPPHPLSAPQQARFNAGKLGDYPMADPVSYMGTRPIAPGDLKPPPGFKPIEEAQRRAQAEDIAASVLAEETLRRENAPRPLTDPPVQPFKSAEESAAVLRRLPEGPPTPGKPMPGLPITARDMAAQDIHGKRYFDLTRDEAAMVDRALKDRDVRRRYEQEAAAELKKEQARQLQPQQEAQPNDRQNIPGVSSAVGKRAEPLQTEPQQITGASEIGRSGVFQEPTEAAGREGLPEPVAPARDAGIQPPTHTYYQGVRAGRLGTDIESPWWTDNLGEAISFAERDGPGGEIRIAKISDFPDTAFRKPGDESGTELVPRTEYPSLSHQLEGTPSRFERMSIEEAKSTYASPASAASLVVPPRINAMGPVGEPTGAAGAAGIQPPPLSPPGSRISSRRIKGELGSIRFRNPFGKDTAEDFVNFDRLNISDREKAKLRLEYEASIAAGILEPKTVESTAAIKEAAQDVGQAQMERTAAQAARSAQDRAATYAMRERVNALSREITEAEGRLQREGNILPQEQLELLNNTIEEKRSALRQMQTMLEKTRASAGRGLRMFGEMSDSDWDTSSWLGQAKRAKGLSPNNELPSDVEVKIRTATARGQDAQAALDKALAESGYDIKAEEALRTQQAQIRDMIAEMEAAGAGRPEIQAELDAARKQYRNVKAQYQRLLAKREEMMTGIPRVKAAATQVMEAKARLQNEIAALEKDGWTELASILLKALPLTGLKTHERNVVGTMLHTHLAEVIRSYPGAWIDTVQAAFGKRQRTMAAVSPQMYWNALRHQWNEGSEAALHTLKHGATREQIMAGDRPREFNFQKDYIPKPVSDKINQFVNTLFRTLAAEDRFNKEFAIHIALQTQAKVQALNEARAGVIKRSQVDARMAEILAAPPKIMMDNALLYGDMATFNSHNRLASAISRERSQWHPLIRLPFDSIVRYIRTPINVGLMALRYDPLIGPAMGIAKGESLRRQVNTAQAALKRDRPNLTQEGVEIREKDIAELKKVITPQITKAYTDAISRGAVGSAIWMLGYYLAEQGILTGYDTSESEGERGTREYAGKPYTSLFIGGEWRNISPLAPMVTPLLMGATLQNGWEQYGKKIRKNPFNVWANLAWAATKGMLDLPMNKGMKDVVELTRSPQAMERGAGRILKSTAASLVPPIITDIDRSVRGINEEAMRLGKGNEIQSRIPGLRGDLPARYDRLGQPIPENPFAAIDMFNSVAPKNDKLSKELLRLAVGIAETDPGTTYVLTNPANGKTAEVTTQAEAFEGANELEKAGIPVTISAKVEPEENTNARRVLVGRMMKMYLDRIVNSPEYENATDYERKEALEAAIAKGRQDVRELISNERFVKMPPEQQLVILQKALNFIPGAAAQ